MLMILVITIIDNRKYSLLNRTSQTNVDKDIGAYIAKNSLQNKKTILSE